MQFCVKKFFTHHFHLSSEINLYFLVRDRRWETSFIADSSLGHINVEMDRHQTSSHMSILFAVVQPKLNMMTTVETQYLAASRQNPYYPFERATYFKLSESGLQISFLVSRERNIGEPLNQFCRQSRQVFTYSPSPVEYIASPLKSSAQSKIATKRWIFGKVGFHSNRNLQNITSYWYCDSSGLLNQIHIFLRSYTSSILVFWKDTLNTRAGQ